MVDSSNVGLQIALRCARLSPMIPIASVSSARLSLLSELLLVRGAFCWEGRQA